MTSVTHIMLMLHPNKSHVFSDTPATAEQNHDAGSNAQQIR
jgi:hypothetical protein